jgi:hypothetical protein
MVYLLTDVGEYRQLPVPGVVTIGRDPSNNFMPGSQSVSKQHAKITLNFIPGTNNKIEILLEDLKARNGTFVGKDPLDIEKITGVRKLHFGDYIRFGFGKEFFQLVERIPAYAEELDEFHEPELQISPSHTNKLPAIGSGRESADFKSLLENSKFSENNSSKRQPGTVVSSSLPQIPNIHGRNQGSSNGDYRTMIRDENEEEATVAQSMDFANLLSSRAGDFAHPPDANRNILTNNDAGLNNTKSKSVTFNPLLTTTHSDNNNNNPNPSPNPSSNPSGGDASFDKLTSFQKYFFPHYSKDYLVKYLKINELWFHQLLSRLLSIERTQPFYVKFLENLMQIKNIHDVIIVSDNEGFERNIDNEKKEDDEGEDQGEEEVKKDGKRRNSAKDKKKDQKNKKEKKRTASDLDSVLSLNIDENEIPLISEIFQSLSMDQRDFICSEFMAENLLLADNNNNNNTGTMNLFGETLVSLFDLLKLCHMGAKQLSGSPNPTNSPREGDGNQEIDYLLSQELISIMKTNMKSLVAIEQSTIVQSLVSIGVEGEEERERERGTDKENETFSFFSSISSQLTFLSQRLDILAKFSSFYFMNSSVNEKTMSNEQIFEIMILYLSVILIVSYKCYFCLLVLMMEMNHLYQKHLDSSQQQTEENSLFQELQRLTLMNYEGAGGEGGGGNRDLKSIVDKLRKHEIDLAGKRYSG